MNNKKTACFSAILCLSMAVVAPALELEAEFDKSPVLVGESLTFVVRATEGGAAATGLSGTAVLGGPGELVETASLVEEGGGDYSATFTPGVPGKYLGKVTISGEKAFAYATVVSGAAKFVEVAPAEPAVADDNGNGLWDRLSVAGTLTGADDGVLHKVYGELLDQDGEAFTTATVELAAGETAFRLDFDGRDLFMSQRGSQVFEVSPLRLLEGDYEELDSRDGVLVDGTEWPWQDFEHDPVTVMWWSDWLAFSEGTNTLYDLMMSLQVYFDAAVAGTYEFQATLCATDGTELGEATGTVELVPFGEKGGWQYIDLRFDGGPICASELDGPYEVTGLTLEKDGVVYDLEGSYDTRAWRADDMDGEGVVTDIAWKYLKATGTWFAQVRVEFLKGREQDATGLRFLFADRKAADGALLAALWSSRTRAAVAQTEVIDGVVYRVVELDVNAAQQGQGVAVYGVSDLVAAGIPVDERVIEMYVARRVAPEVGNEAAAGVDDFTAWLVWEANGETHKVAVPALEEPEPEPEPEPPYGGAGTLDDPYTPAGAAAAVADLTWTSNTEYESTGEVYVQGKISRIAEHGTYTEGGTYGNATYYISADGTENGEFYVYRSLYFNQAKYVSGTDIQVGDDVIICGQLMNYKGTTPETVSAKAWLYSLNGHLE